MVMNENYIRSIPVTVFAFASPLVGNLSFAQHVEEIGVKVLRLVNKKDLVPTVPGVFVNEKMCWLARIMYWFPWTYVHLGIEITLDSSNSQVLKKTYNPSSFHNLEVYLHLVDGLPQNNNPPFKLPRRDPALVNKNSDLLIKEIVKRMVAKLVYSPRSPTGVSISESPSLLISNLVIVLEAVVALFGVMSLFHIGSRIYNQSDSIIVQYNTSQGLLI
ncbi:hypothetical protein SUGI_0894170 [Cryptomeria japonica]|nr:hypothetical protein SUGI_0894170 [Cryptomeria japonica]